MHLSMPVELRHVYRALLRAATYLPDSASRTYIHSHVVQRFRSVSDKIRSTNDLSRGTLIARYHGRDHIQKTRQRARQLERAGLGSLPDLRKVLLTTYGRLGSRKRELIRALLLPEEDSSSDSASLESFIAERLTEENARSNAKKMRGYPADSKVGSFLRSQMAVAPLIRFLITTAKIKSVDAQIPSENIWGRPMPVRRQTSMAEKHWKDVLSNIFPPVPSHEWNRLRDLATGVLPIEEPPLRRARPVTEEVLDGERNTTALLDYFITPVDQRRMRGLDTDEVIINKEGARYWPKARTTAVVPGSKKYTHTTRLMRRLYASIWNITPTMEYEEATRTWTTKWGPGRTPFLAGRITAPKATDMELFEGAEKTEVKSKGRKIKKGKVVEINDQISAPDQMLHRITPRETGYTQGVIAGTTSI